MPFTEFYVQPTGSNLNAGSTADDAALQTYAGGTFVRSTGVFTVASGNPVTDGVAVDDWASIYTTAGATQPGMVGRVTARTSTTITVSTTVLAGATANVSESGGAATLKVGGAWAGLSAGVGFPLGFVAATLRNAADEPPRVNIKKGGSDYIITTALTHANNGPIFWRGYDATPGDGGLAKFFGDSASPTAPYTMLTISGTGNIWEGLWFDDNGGTTAGQSVGNNCMVELSGTANYMRRCRFTGAYRSGLRQSGGGNLFVECEASGCNRDDAAAFGQYQVLEESTWRRCISHSSNFGTDSSGWLLASDSAEPVAFIGCIAANLGSHGWEGSGNHHSVSWDGCIAYDCAQSGIHINGAIATTSVMRVENSLFVNNGDYGLTLQNADHRSAPHVIKCGFYGNGIAQVHPDINTAFVEDSITLTGDPFVDAVNGDFRLNDTAGAGAACQGAGRGAFLINTAIMTAGAANVGAPDLGACQTVLPSAAAIAADVWAYAERTLTA